MRCCHNNQSRRLKMHTHRMIFPRVSFYLEMIKYISRKDALALLNKAIEIGFEDDVKRLKSITRFRFFRSLFIRLFPLAEKFTFNEKSGFETKALVKTGKQYRVDILKCPYFKYCEMLGCKELTSTFCLSDDYIYGNMTGIKYKRCGTLGCGYDRCDFDFMKE